MFGKLKMLLYLATKLRDMLYKKGFSKCITEIDWNNESFYIFTLDGDVTYCPHGFIHGVIKKDDPFNFVTFTNLAYDFRKYGSVRNFIGMVKESEGRNEFLQKLKPFIKKMKRLKVFNDDMMTEQVLSIQIYNKNA